MTKPVRHADFDSARPAGAARAWLTDGLPDAIDAVAAAAPATHRFLRRGWFAAAVTAYGGPARTIVAEGRGAPALALPLVPLGPAMLGLAQVPGSYWPFRGVPIAEGAGPDVLDAAIGLLGATVRGLRIGPIYDGDATATPLIAALRARGWAALPRFIADSYLLDLIAARGGGPFPRASTLKKNRFHEKHLASHGAPDWRFHGGADWEPALFAALATVERSSWIGAETDGRDAKFTDEGHGTFWRTAAADPVVASMMSAALLTIDGRPAAFSFDLDVGTQKYAIANSYDPAYAKHSPGKLLYWRNIARAIELGITAVDWGAGDSGYKRVIGAEPGPAIRDWLLLPPPLATLGTILAPLWRRSGNPG